MTRTLARLCAALLGLGLLTLAVPAWAHVTVSSTDASQGGFGKAVFRVPNESGTASTTKVQVTFPADTPFAFVSAGAKPGWKVTTDTDKLDSPRKVGDFELTEVVRSITWTSTGDGIATREFDEFAVSAGPFPSADDISFTATQTYSDGDVVAWDQEQVGDTEPDKPAPVLALAASPEDSAEPASDVAAASATTASSDSGIALAVAIAAAVVAAAALLVSVRQNRRRA